MQRRTPLKEVRQQLSLSLADMAAFLGVSRATVQGYERRDEAGTILPATRKKYLEAIGVAHIDDQRPLTPEQERSRRQHLQVLAELANDPDRVLGVARRNIEKIRSIRFSEPWAQRWEEVLDAGIEAVEDALYSREQWAADLRQSSPFAGVLERAQ